MIELPLQKVVTKELIVKGSCAINGEYPAVLDLISSGKVNVNNMMSAVAPLSEGASWFDRLYDKEKGLLKVILNP
jgi:L-iditol 2-dehydrogenase